MTLKLAAPLAIEAGGVELPLRVKPLVGTPVTDRPGKGEQLALKCIQADVEAEDVGEDAERWWTTLLRSARWV